MTPEQFTYWLKGYFELSDALVQDPQPLEVEQVELIREKLAEVERDSRHFLAAQPLPSNDIFSFVNSTES